MALSSMPGLRVLGHEPDEVSIEITVTGKRARQVAAALLTNVKAPSEVIPLSIGVPGLDRITGGVLTDTDAAVNRFGEDVEMTFTIQATVERDDA